MRNRTHIALTIAAGSLGMLTLAALAKPPLDLPPNLPAAPANGPALCQGNFLTPEQGKAVLDFTLSQVPTKQAWQQRAAFEKQHILDGAGLNPLPRRGELKPIISAKRSHDGYTVENVAFESIPGYYVTGNLYRPATPAESMPAVLCTHGHGTISPAEAGPRFGESMQRRCASLARMGAVVFSIDMFGYGDSQAMVPAEAHKTTLAMPMQIFGGMRAIDFLSSLPGVDPKRIAVTGESGGGTQSFVLTALDDRIAVSVPVVMVSSYFFGGCACESGRPIHRSAEHFNTNAEIAALAAPRPMLVLSDGKDWTQHVPETEFPFLQKIYALNGAEASVENVHLAAEGHDYGPSKRDAMYRFLAKQFKLDASKTQDASGKLDESHVTVEPAAAMRVFDDAHPLPMNALKGAAAVEAALKAQQAQG
jgi:dienelactone hydrolase